MTTAYLDTLQARYMLGYLSTIVERGESITPAMWDEAMELALEWELKR
jgi:hypothetical protein